MTPTLFKTLREVKGMIENQIKKDVQAGRRPADTVETLFSNLDVDTVKWFLAETVKASDWDGRFSERTKEWAKQLYVPVLHGEDGGLYGQISDSVVHHAHLNQIIEAAIKA